MIPARVSLVQKRASSENQTLVVSVANRLAPHRPDQPVFVHRLIARGTIEEKILSLQDRKRSLAATLWGEGEGTAAPAKLAEEDVRFLLGRAMVVF